MIYTVYMWAVIVLAVIVYGGVLFLVLPVANPLGWDERISRAWARFIVRRSGVRFELSGADRLDLSRPVVYMSNHQSYFDVLCQVAYLPLFPRFVAKKELVWLPLFGQLMWATGHVIVDRGKRDKAVASMKKAAQKISSGTSILVYPEGTRSPDHRLGPFKKGGFLLAVEAGVPLLPVSVAGTHPMMPKGGYTFTKSDVIMVLGDPIDTRGKTQADIQELMDRTRAAIIQNFPKDSAEWEANKQDPVLSGTG